jgi:hypothetical protein
MSAANERASAAAAAPEPEAPSHHASQQEDLYDVPQHVTVFDVDVCPPGMQPFSSNAAKTGGPVAECMDIMQGVFRNKKGQLCMDTTKCPGLDGLTMAGAPSAKAGAQAMTKTNVRELFEKLVPQQSAATIRERAIWILRHLMLPLLPAKSLSGREKLKANSVPGNTLLRLSVGASGATSKYYMLPLEGDVTTSDVRLCTDDMPYVEYVPFMPFAARGTRSARMYRVFEELFLEITDSVEYWQGMARLRVEPGMPTETLYIRLFRLLGLLPLRALGTDAASGKPAPDASTAAAVFKDYAAVIDTMMTQYVGAMEYDAAAQPVGTSAASGAATAGPQFQPVPRNPARQSMLQSSKLQSVLGTLSNNGQKSIEDMAGDAKVAYSLGSAGTGSSTAAAAAGTRTVAGTGLAPADAEDPTVYAGGDVLGLEFAVLARAQALYSGRESGVALPIPPRLTASGAIFAVWDPLEILGWAIKAPAPGAAAPVGADFRQTDLQRLRVTPRDPVYVSQPVPEARFNILPSRLLGLDTDEELRFKSRIQQLVLQMSTRKYIDRLAEAIRTTPALEKELRAQPQLGSARQNELPYEVSAADLKLATPEELAEGVASEIVQCAATGLEHGQDTSAGLDACKAAPRCEPIVTGQRTRKSDSSDKAQAIVEPVFKCLPKSLVAVGFFRDNDNDTTPEDKAPALLERYPNSELAKTLREFGAFMEQRYAPRLAARAYVLGGGRA